MNNRTEYENQQVLIAALVNNRPFPHAVKTVRMLETHISWVLLAGRYAYKIKKSVNLGFLDFTGLDTRKLYCEEEIRLNRRFAPAIYLDVIPVGGSPGSPEFGMQPAIEYAVRMRRFAMSGQLDRLVARGMLTSEIIDRLAVTLSSFHAGIPPADLHMGFGTPSNVLEAAMQNFDQLRPLLTAQSDRDAAASLSKITQGEYAACYQLFEQRRTRGSVRECHGDLHLGNIVLIGDEPVPCDGIEFNPGLRWIDVMNDAAFLVMDLRHHRRPDLACRFLNGWLEVTGDYAGISVLRFYLAYRAMVRAKVNAIRACQTGNAGKRAIAACRGYLALANECFVRRPALIITHGLPGSGKSTYALAAAERLQAIRIRSDVERKRMFGINPQAKSHSGMQAGIYSANATHRTYARLLELSRELLDAGFPVIVDAAFLRQNEREEFHALALDKQAPFAIVSMQAGEDVLHARIMRRQGSQGDASEADINVMQTLQATRQPLAQHELDYEMKVLNDRDGFNADEQEWGILNRLLAAQAL